jgi:hypothetical protein
VITSSNVKDYLKSKIDGVDRWYSGSLRSNDVKGICVYSKPSMGTNKVCVGGLENTSTFIQGYSVLIHWTKNTIETELKSMEIYNALWGQNPVINGHRVIKIDLRDANPIGLGVDDNGIYEYVINFDILYER